MFSRLTWRLAEPRVEHKVGFAEHLKSSEPAYGGLLMSLDVRLTAASQLNSIFDLDLAHQYSMHGALAGDHPEPLQLMIG
jgi:hypothetical protein